MPLRRSAQKISVPRRLVLQLHQRQRDVDRRMPAADDQHALAGIAVRARRRVTSGMP